MAQVEGSGTTTEPKSGVNRRNRCAAVSGDGGERPERVGFGATEYDGGGAVVD